MTMIRKIFIFTLCMSYFLSGQAQNFPTPMQPRRLVNDFTQLFSRQEVARLENKLAAFNKASSTQIAVVTVASLDGLDINDYAARLGEKWGIGRKGKDNGILLLIKPKQGREKGEVAISVGYGLEGAIPDVTAARIIRKEILPAFQQGKYYQGVHQATSVLMDLAKGEFTAEAYQKQGDGSFIVFLPFLLFILLSLFIRQRRGYSPGHASPPFFIGGTPFGGYRGSSFEHFSSGSGSFGGFGGFGGGSFGGGGASGSW